MSNIEYRMMNIQRNSQQPVKHEDREDTKGITNFKSHIVGSRSWHSQFSVSIRSSRMMDVEFWMMNGTANGSRS